MITPLLAAAALAGATPAETVAAMFAAFNRHDARATAALYTADARLTSTEYCAPRDGRDVERSYAALFAAFPDLRDNVDTMVADGDRVAVRFTARSPATGLALRIMTFLRVRDGRIVEDDTIFDAGGAPCKR